MILLLTLAVAFAIPNMRESNIGKVLTGECSLRPGSTRSFNLQCPADHAHVLFKAE